MKKIVLILNIIAILSGKLCSQNPVWTQTANPSFFQVNGVAFSSDGQKVISGTDCHPSRIRHYDLSNGNVTYDYTVGGSLMCIMGVGFSSNGNYFSAVEEMGNILVFDNTLTTPVVTNTIVMGTTYAFSIDFAPNSCKMAVGGSNGKLQTYVVSTGSQNLNIAAHGSWVTAVNYSPNNTMIASGGSDAIVKIWDTTGLLLKTLNGHTGQISAVKFSKNNTKLLSASLDNSIKVWSVSSGSLIQTITPSASDVKGIDVSNDNNHFVSVSADNVIRIYNLNNYSLEASFGLTTSGTPLCVAWSPTNMDKIAVGYSNGTVTLYDISLITSVDENARLGNNFVAFPNPFTDRINLNFQKNTLKSLEIYDIEGRLIDTKTNLEEKSELVIDSKQFEKNACYFVCLKTINNDIIVKKIVKQNF